MSPSPIPVTVDAHPRAWPSGASLDQVRVAVLSIDFQRDFCLPGGFADALGFDLGAIEGAKEQAKVVLAAARRVGWPVVHTRVGHRPDLSDRFPHRLAPPPAPDSGPDSGLHRPAVGDEGPMGRYLIRGEHGYDLVPELGASEGEVVLDKTGKGAFYCTELDLILRNAGITHLVFVGITSDVCVQTTYREASDRGYESLWVSDATGSYWPEAHEAAVLLAGTQGGILGTVATTAELVGAMAALDDVHIPDQVLVDANGGTR